MNEKKVIDYSRTYRKMGVNKISCGLYIAILLIVGLLFLWINMGNLTAVISEVCARELQKFVPGTYVGIQTETYPLFGEISYLTAGTVFPGFNACLINAVISFGLIVILAICPWKGQPLPIYLILNAGIHLVNSLWFLFAGSYFPYTTTDYSQIYIFQEIGIWTMFFVMTVVITGITGSLGLGYKLLTVFSVMAYSVAFGAIRYFVFMYLLHRFSILYMAIFYFTIGPMFDFLYLVMIYAMFVNRMIKLYDSRKGRGVWKWL